MNELEGDMEESSHGIIWGTGLYPDTGMYDPSDVK
jgi:hypothetical protein